MASLSLDDTLYPIPATVKKLILMFKLPHIPVQLIMKFPINKGYAKFYFTETENVILEPQDTCKNSSFVLSS